MLKKMMLALVIGGLSLGGVALAQPAQGNPAPDRQAMKAKRQAMKQQMLQKFDANKDGTLDAQERTNAFDTIAAERFKTMDTDGNGVLSLAEFKAGKQKMGKRLARAYKHGKRGHGPHGPRGAGNQ